MKNKFAILLPSGDIQTISARNMAEAASQFPDALKIESIDKIQLKKRIAGLKDDLASVSYLATKEIDPFFQKALTLNGFDVSPELAKIGTSNDGQINIDIGG